jgi:hypothetical protein
LAAVRQGLGVWASVTTAKAGGLDDQSEFRGEIPNT